MAGINSEKFFGGVWETLKKVIGQVTVQEAAKIPAVKEQVAQEKLKIGKEALWSAFPVILIGALAFFVIRKF